MSLPPPLNPLQAVTHPDPDPYYERLARERPVYRDESLGMWVAAGRQAVSQALGDSRLHVRPVDEPVPQGIQGTGAGRIFARLARMNEGPRHDIARNAAIRELERWNTAVIDEAWPLLAARDIATVQWHLPVYCLARSLGVSCRDLTMVTTEVAALVHAFAAGATKAQVEAGSVAADRLLARFEDRGDETATANAIGVLIQGYEATAGRIGNRVLWRRGQTSRELPTVHNTRRFAAEETEILGHRVERGATVLVLLIQVPFGDGRHQCPGERVAGAIADAALQKLDAQKGRHIGYRTSPNLRIPLFAQEELP